MDEKLEVQYSILSDLFGELLIQTSSFDCDIQSLPREKAAVLSNHLDCPTFLLHEIPFPCLINLLLFEVMNTLPGFSIPDNTTALVKSVLAYDPDAEEDDLSLENDAPETGLLLALITTISRSLLAKSMYSRYISELLHDYSAGYEKAIFDAIRSDPAVLGCPTVAVAIHKASILGNDSFLKKVRQALKGPENKQLKVHQQKRLLLQAIDETDGLDTISRSDLHELFTEHLKLVPKGGEDPYGAFSRFVTRFKSMQRQKT